MSQDKSTAAIRRKPTATNVNSAPDTLLRQWSLLQRVPGYPTKTTAAALTTALKEEGFAISKRSVERDLQLLSDRFPLLCDDRSRPHGWSWKRDARPLRVPGLQMHEAVLFKLAQQHLAALLPSSLQGPLAAYFDMADQRLRDAQAGRGPAAWPARVRVVPPTQPLLAPQVVDAVFRGVTTALLDGVRLQARYRARGAPRVSEYPLNPLGLVQRGPATYLVATIRDHDDPTLFALHRFKSAAPLDEPTRAVPGFNLDAYIAGGALGFEQSANPLRLVARFDRYVAEHLRETPLSADQKMADDGDRVRLTATVADTSQLRWWLLGFADQVEVLAPKALRAELAKKTAAAARRYRGRR